MADKKRVVAPCQETMQDGSKFANGRAAQTKRCCDKKDAAVTFAKIAIAT